MIIIITNIHENKNSTRILNELGKVTRLNQLEIIVKIWFFLKNYQMLADDRERNLISF